MTFTAKESSRYEGAPIYLYEFRYGPEATSVERYTNVGRSVTIAADDPEDPDITFEPIAIKSSDMEASGRLDKSSLTVELPEDCAIAALFRGEPPSSIITLKIRQGHDGDAEYRVAWVGRVLDGSFPDDHLNLDCEPITTSLRRTGLTREYQYACPLVLFGPSCRASKVAATITVEVLDVDGPLIALPADWTTAERKERFIGGIAQWTASDGRLERRSIVDHEGDMITLSSQARGLSAEDTITLIRGCNHLQDGCRDHGNILNFGGQPAIPLKNPIGIVNNY